MKGVGMTPGSGEYVPLFGWILGGRAAFGWLLLAGLLLSACADSGGNTKTQNSPPPDGLPRTDPLPRNDPAPFTTSSLLLPSPVVTSLVGLVDVTVVVPESSLAMGIIVQGTNPNCNLIDHGGLFLGGNITGPDGPVPYEFPLSYPDGNRSNGSPIPVALTSEAVAVHFPNSGESATLPAGTYTFPVAATDFSDCTLGGGLATDILTATVYYKTPTATTPTLKLNVFMVAGVNGAVTNVDTAASDPELSGAIQVLKNVYQNNAATGVTVDVTVDFINDAAFAILETHAEFFSLLQNNPFPPTHDAMNIFVIDSLQMPGVSAGVIGISPGVPGPFNRQGTASSGTLAEYQNDGIGTILGFVLAHEFGHFLGLFHTSQTDGGATAIVGEDPIADTPVCTTTDLGVGGIDNCPDRDNLMFPFVDNNPDPPITNGQGNVIKFNPGITVP